MRQTSPFVSALLFLTGAFLLLAALVRGEMLVAAGVFTLCFAFWLALQVNRDPLLELQKTKRYLRIAALIGALAAIASLVDSAGTLMRGDYRDALRGLAPAIFIFSIAWRYRKDWPVWLGIKPQPDQRPQ